MTNKMSDASTIAIFIAGEDEDFNPSIPSKEYQRYQDSFSVESIECDELAEIQDHEHWNASVGELRPLSSAQNTYTTRLPSCLLGIKYFIHRPSSNYTVVVVDKNEYLRKYKDKLQSNNKQFTLDDVRGVLGFVSSLLSAITSRNNLDLGTKSLHLELFVHWHVEPTPVEDSFSRLLKKVQSEDKGILRVNDVPISRFRHFAVSSLLPERINLNAISVPATVEELEHLIEGIIDKAKRAKKSTKQLFKSPINDNALQGKLFLLVNANTKYATDSIANLAKILKARGARVITLGDLANSCPKILASKPYKDELRKWVKELCREIANAYPLFIGTMRWIEEFGATPPKEFVYCVEDDVLTVAQLKELSNKILARTIVWSKDDKLRNGIDLNTLRQWCTGAYRVFCRLDKDVHAAGKSIDLDVARDSPEAFWERESVSLYLRSHGCDVTGKTIDPLNGLRCLWEILFPENMAAFRDATEGRADKFYEKFVEEVIVVPLGVEIAFKSPTRRIKVLLIDDTIEQAKTDASTSNNCETLLKDVLDLSALRSESDKKLLGDVLDLSPLKVAIGAIDESHSRDDFDKAVQDITKTITEDSFDAILLDLHLGKGEDPAGYQLIRILKIFLPTIPIIIYSRYDDMGHIERAFRMGATWYIKKDEAYKLPRHFISLLTLKEWQKEWKSINSLGLFVDSDFNIEPCCSDDSDKIKKHEAFCKKFDGATDEGVRRRYLTYKVLEQYPGRRMFLHPMGGGFSAAATFRVVKKDAQSEEVLQSPLIVKIDREFYTRTEFERYFRFIRPYIANETGRVETPAVTIDADNSAIVYTYAGKSGTSNELLTFRDMFSKDILNLTSCRYEGYAKILDDLFTNILPRIHNVPVTNDLALQYSSYPNHFLGEVEAKGNGFVGNYRVRMPLARHYNVLEFCHSTDSGDDIIPFEYKDKTPDNAIEALECQDKGNGAYSKMTVILEGAIVEHVVRFRSELLIPGKMLYVKVSRPDKVTNPNSEIVQENLAGCLDEILANNTNYLDVFLNDTAEFNGRTWKKLDHKKYFIKLFHKLAGIQKRSGLEDFNTVVKKLYERSMEIIKNNPGRFSCREGIVHGDLNFANIMLDRSSGNAGRLDVWLIDFARTRRDVIAHDFNVFFTATLAQLFKNELWYDVRQIDPYAFAKKLLRVFRKFAVDVIFGDVSAVGGLSDVPPDYVASDRRLKMAYQILRRVRKAAIEAKVANAEGALPDDAKMRQEDVYAMTTALCCLYTFRIFLKHEKNVQGAAALLAVAYLCLDRLERSTVVTKV